MFDEKSLFLSVSEVACFDGDAGAGDGGGGDAGGGGGDAGTGAGGDAGAGDAGGKLLDQAAVNKIVEERLARDRKSRETSHKEKYEKLDGMYNTLLENKNLSDEERTKAENHLAEVKNQLRTKEERAKHEKDQLENDYETRLSQAKKDEEVWKTRFHDSSIQRSLQDAAVSHDAYNPAQVTGLLRSMTSLKPVVDDAGKETGQFRTVVDFPDHDEKGEEVTFSGTPDEIVKRMKDLDDFANLFKANVVAGLGAGQATGGANTGSNGHVDVSKLTTAQYRKLRKENPAAIGM